MADGSYENNPDLREIVRAIRELSARLERLEARLDRELAAHSSELPSAIASQGPSLSHHEALESRIGSQWLNRVGVVAVLFGVAYLLRYAFVQQWISAAAWIWLGVCSGLVVIAGSEWFRRRGYRVLSLSLKATGIGVSYLSLWAGLELYRLLSGSGTFIGFVLVTILGAVLALRESAQVLAALALIGGFLTPLLVSMPVGQFPLFAYIALLDCSAVVILLRRDWWNLLPLAFLGTFVLCATWYFGHYRRSDLAAAVTAATVFFGIFCATAVSMRYLWPARRSALLIISEAANPVVYFTAMYLLLDTRYHHALAVPAFGLAVLFSGLAWRVETSLRFVPGQVVALYGGLAIASIAVGLAILVDPDWLSLAWFFEAAAVVAIGFWRELPWLRWGGLLLLCAAIVKAFAYDVWQLSLAYRTLSFIGLGILLLIMSFAYQRYGFSLIAKGRDTGAALR